MSEDSHDFIWPVLGPVTSGFDDPRPWGPHGAIDIAVPNDTPVLSVASGSVSAIAHNDLAGNFVVLTHPDGWQTSYAHLRANPPIAVGQKVTCGQLLALSDNTGYSTGPHLHFVMYKDGVRVDPLLYLPQPPTQECAMTDADFAALKARQDLDDKRRGLRRAVFRLLMAIEAIGHLHPTPDERIQVNLTLDEISTIWKKWT